MSGKSGPINIIDRSTGKVFQEKVTGEWFLRFTCENSAGRLALNVLIKRKIFSCIYGHIMNCFLSKAYINSFIKSFEIDMAESEVPVNGFSCFNDFFIRKLKQNARPVLTESDILISPADGRLLAYQQFDGEDLFQIKGSMFKLSELLQNQPLTGEFYNGSIIIIRLAPPDYHRFHFSDSGTAEYTRNFGGSYFSVSPISLARIARVYCRNRRAITLFKSDNFGDMLIIEVGASCVGSIMQTFVPGGPVEKGREKGCFKFGGSTVILILKAGVIDIDSDLLQNTEKGLETLIRTGQSLGRRRI